MLIVLLSKLSDVVMQYCNLEMFTIALAQSVPFYQPCTEDTIIHDACIQSFDHVCGLIVKMILSLCKTELKLKQNGHFVH